MKKSIKNIFFALCLICVLFSCATTKGPEVPVLTKYDDMMFWKIEGSDLKGRLSTIYVLGTIHIGDDRLYPIPQEIANAYGAADKVYGEISTEDWKTLIPKTQRRMSEGALEIAEIQEERGYVWYDNLKPEYREFLEKKLQNQVLEAGKANMPWVMSSLLSDLSLAGTGLTSNYAYDTHFITVSNQFGIPMYGLDAMDVQLDVMTYGDFDFQLELLTSTIEEMINDENAVYQETIDMYEAYLTGDASILEDVLLGQLEAELEAQPEYQGYYDALFLNRNLNWAETFSQLLYEGGTTFVFAGSGHFIGKDSVFAIMKDKGDLVY